MWALRGYRPQRLTGVDQVLDRHGDRLAALVGRRLTGAVGLCSVQDGDWCGALPVRLDLDGEHLELAVAGIDELYLSWGELDTTEPPDTDEQDDPELALAWTPLDLPELRRVAGATVAAVRVLRRLWRLVPPHGEPVESWVLGGVELVFDGDRGALQAGNALGALGFTLDDPAAPCWLRTGIPATGLVPGPAGGSG